MSNLERKHFDRISRDYDRASKSWRSFYECIRKYLDPLIADKRVLDVGSGGKFPYNTALPSEVVALDISPGMLETVDDLNVVKRVGDARDLRCIEDDSADVVLFILSLHHINGHNVAETFSTLEKVLSSARRTLRPGGHLAIVEPLLPKWLFRIESVAFPLTQTLLTRFDVSMIFFYSLDFLKERLARHFSLEASAIRIERIVIEDRIDPFGGSFPGLISVPEWMLPVRYILMILRYLNSSS